MGNEVIVDESNLQPYLVKIFDHDSKKVNGTGFICHPTGYIITCYHVIKRYIEAGRTNVNLNYQDEICQAQIYKKLCLEKADIAIVKLVGQRLGLPYLDIDVHKRWHFDDVVFSTGYPQDSDSFKNTGIGITGSLSVAVIGMPILRVPAGQVPAPIMPNTTK